MVCDVSVCLVVNSTAPLQNYRLTCSSVRTRPSSTTSAGPRRSSTNWSRCCNTKTRRSASYVPCLASSPTKSTHFRKRSKACNITWHVCLIIFILPAWRCGHCRFQPFDCHRLLLGVDSVRLQMLLMRVC